MMPTSRVPDPVISCRNLLKSYYPSWFRVGQAKHVLREIDLAVYEGECVALLGESGSGKSTLGRQLMGFESPSAGQVLYRGRPLQHLDARARKDFRCNVQMVFQDSVAAVNPRFRIGRIIEEPLRHLSNLSEDARRERVAELLILRPDMPRSLLACLNEVIVNLSMITGDPLSETQRRAGKLRADLQYARIDEILSAGLHAFLMQFLDRVNELGAHISREFLLPVTR